MPKKTYTCMMTFEDENMPVSVQKEPTDTLAIATINHWSKNFAGIKSLCFIDPEGNKHCFYRNGQYAFTIPAQVIKQLELAR